MTVRAVIEDETIEQMNEKLRYKMRVDPESQSVDTKINVLLYEVDR
jgi:hypothetical protein